MPAPTFEFLVFAVFSAAGVMAVVLITLGVRGRPVFSEPSCSGCGYDLRGANFANGAPQSCPECGRSLRGPGAVNFGRYEHHPHHARTGVLLVVLIIVGLYAIPVFMRRAARVANVPPPALNVIPPVQ